MVVRYVQPMCGVTVCLGGALASLAASGPQTADPRLELARAVGPLLSIVTLALVAITMVAFIGLGRWRRRFSRPLPHSKPSSSTGPSDWDPKPYGSLAPGDHLDKH